MTDLKRTFLFCLLGVCIYAFGFICWLYPYIWKDKEAQTDIDTELYDTDYITLNYGQQIEINRLKEHTLNEK